MLQVSLLHKMATILTMLAWAGEHAAAALEIKNGRVPAHASVGNA